MLKKNNYDPGEIINGKRETPNGDFLTWKIALNHFNNLPGDGLIPFLIDWGSSPHPSNMTPQGCKLLKIRAEHPNPQKILEVLDAM